jgi:hypothetical protein
MKRSNSTGEDNNSNNNAKRVKKEKISPDPEKDNIQEVSSKDISTTRTYLNDIRVQVEYPPTVSSTVNDVSTVVEESIPAVSLPTTPNL